jgi:hypothetical protein
MFKYLLLIFLFISFSSYGESVFRCKNIKGVDLLYTKSGEEFSKDAYSGLTLNLTVHDNNDATMNWEGGFNSGFKEDLIGTNASEDGWITWISSWPQVTRMYTLFFQSNKKAQLSMIESQTQSFTNYPQVRSFFGSCN